MEVGEGGSSLRWCEGGDVVVREEGESFRERESV